MARDDEENIETLHEEDLYGGTVKVTVFDMEEVYRSLGFGPRMPSC
jgi:hypothetical protein